MPQADRRAGKSLASSRILTVGVLVPVVALLVIASAHSDLAAQTAKTQEATPVTERRFEVASVKPNKQTLAEYISANQGNLSAAPAVMGIRTLPGGRMTASFVTLRALILRAFEIKDYQLEGGPDWLGTTNFEINAKADGDATPAEFNAMLKALLIERFALRTRTQSKDLPLHVLTLARSDGRLGSQLKPTSEACLAEMEERRKNPGQQVIPPRPAARTVEEMREMMRTPRCGVSSMSSSTSSMTYSFSGLPFNNLVSRLSSELNAPVVDKTGLTGNYDAVLEYEPVRRQATLSANPNPQEPAVLMPPLRTALQQQLGLKLEDTKGPLDVIIIESVQQPTPD